MLLVNYYMSFCVPSLAFPFLPFLSLNLISIISFPFCSFLSFAFFHVVSFPLLPLPFLLFPFLPSLSSLRAAPDSISIEFSAG